LLYFLIEKNECTAFVQIKGEAQMLEIVLSSVVIVALINWAIKNKSNKLEYIVSERNWKCRGEGNFICQGKAATV